MGHKCRCQNTESRKTNGNRENTEFSQLQQEDGQRWEDKAEQLEEKAGSRVCLTMVQTCLRL